MTEKAGTPPKRSSAQLDLSDRLLVVPVERAWSATVGFERALMDDGTMEGSLSVTEAVCQPMGLLHGGIYACIAEDLASVGTAQAVVDDGKWCVGMSNSTNFMRPARLGGRVDAVARPIHAGRTTWVWEVEMRNEDGKLCARSTVTMAVREGDRPPPPTSA